MEFAHDDDFEPWCTHCGAEEEGGDTEDHRSTLEGMKLTRPFLRLWYLAFVILLIRFRDYIYVNVR